MKKHKRQKYSDAFIDSVYEDIRSFGDSDFTIAEYASLYGLTHNAAYGRLRELVKKKRLFSRLADPSKGYHSALLFSREPRKQKEVLRLIKLRELAITVESEPFHWAAFAPDSGTYRQARIDAVRAGRIASNGGGVWQFSPEFVADSYDKLGPNEETLEPRLIGAAGKRYEAIRKRREWLTKDPVGKCAEAFWQYDHEKAIRAENALRRSDLTMVTLAKRAEWSISCVAEFLNQARLLQLVASESEQHDKSRPSVFYWWNSPIRLRDVFAAIDSDPYFDKFVKPRYLPRYRS